MIDRPSSSLGAPGAAAEVIIAGGGVAALEAALALRALAGDRVRITLLTPASEFVYQPIAVLEPYERTPARRLALTKFAAGLDAAVMQDALATVDATARRLVTRGGRELAYDALLVAVGAAARPPLPDAVLLRPARPDERLNALIEELGDGSIRSLAFVAPRPTWPLPVYELALLARERAQMTGSAVALVIVTAEDRPLEVFGPAVSEAAAHLLAGADIEVHAGSTAQPSADGLTITPGETELNVDRVVAIPRLQGPYIPGLECDEDGFLPVTAHGAVVGVEGVYAAGDATTFPVKFGAIAAQQADAAAESIAALAGAEIEPAPFDGIVHGILLSGRRERLYFSARIEDGSALESRISDRPTWAPEAKIAARHLGPYLDELWASGLRWVSGQLAWERTLSRLEAESVLSG